MKSLNRYILSIPILMILFGCGELEAPVTDQFVVEAFVTAEAAISDIRVKETGSLSDDSLVDKAIENAIITISNSESDVLLQYNENTGQYYDPDGFLPIIIDQAYNIEVTVGEVTATSSTIVPEKPTGLELSDSVLVVPTLALNFTLREQITRLFEEEIATLTWTSIPGRSYFVVIETQEETIDPILPSAIPEESRELLSSFRFISAPSENNSFDIIAIALETYGRHVAKVFSVNQEYVDLFNSATQDSRDLNEPPSNVTNALGIFSAFAVDSLEFELRRN